MASRDLTEGNEPKIRIRESASYRAAETDEKACPSQSRDQRIDRLGARRPRADEARSLVVLIHMSVQFKCEVLLQTLDLCMGKE